MNDYKFETRRRQFKSDAGLGDSGQNSGPDSAVVIERRIRGPN